MEFLTSSAIRKSPTLPTKIAHYAGVMCMVLWESVFKPSWHKCSSGRLLTTSALLWWASIISALKRYSLHRVLIESAYQGSPDRSMMLALPQKNHHQSCRERRSAATWHHTSDCRQSRRYLGETSLRGSEIIYSEL